MKNILYLMLVTAASLLAACQSTPAQLPTVTLALTPTSTWTAQPTVTPTPTLTPTPVPTQAPMPTPFWGPAAWVCYASTCTPSSSEPVSCEVKPGEYTQFVEFAYRLNRPPPPLRLASFQVDLLVEDTNHTEPFSVHMDLHGFGTVRSWYAQMGYSYNEGNLGVFCQAYSYSSKAPRYWHDAPCLPRLGTWHTFKIEVIPTDVEWHYTFLYWYDGAHICTYQPPDLWDGDDRYQVLRQAVEIYPNTAWNTGSTSIRAQARNAYLYVLDSPGPTP